MQKVQASGFVLLASTDIFFSNARVVIIAVIFEQTLVLNLKLYDGNDIY